LFSAALLLMMHGLYTSLRVSNINSFPRPLKSDEEEKYLKLAASGDINARNKLIEHNLRLVAHIIKKYYVNASDQDDLISIGTIGLIKAISSFQGSHGTKLATYAARCIENEILMHFRAQKHILTEVSLSDPLDTDGDGNILELIDIVSTDDEILERIDSVETSKKIQKLVNSVLDDREKSIIIMRYGLSNKPPMPQREVAKVLNISRSYVSRIEKKALEKLRKYYD